MNGTGSDPNGHCQWNVHRTIFSEAIMAKAADIDPFETREWLDSLHAVLQHNGAERASFLIGELTDAAQSARADRQAWRGSHLYPGPLRAGHLCARFRGRSANGSTVA